MAFVPFPTGTVSTVLSFILNGLPVSITNGWQKTGGAPATVTDGQSLADAVADWWNTNLKSVSSPDIELEGATAYDLTSSSGWSVTSPLLHSGTGTGSVPTNAAAMVVTLQTANRGRSFRGRNYVPGLPSSQLASPVFWDTGATGAMNTAYTALQAGGLAAGFVLGVLSRVENKHPLTTGVFTPVITHRANARIGTIRGRLK